MEEGSTTDRFVRTLAADQRVLVVGGLAVIAHGLSRSTMDADIWLDPQSSTGAWVECLMQVMGRFSGTSFWSIANRAPADRELAARDARDFGMIRVSGLDLPLDVLRRPNECTEADFDAFWRHSSPLADGTRLPDPIDLYLTKVDTGRDQDWQDQVYLERKVRAQFREQLPGCSLEQAEDLFARFLDPETLEFALQNPESAVRDLALQHLREFEQQGDPYSRDILLRWEHGR
jgi:hypothetical protein